MKLYRNLLMGVLALLMMGSSFTAFASSHREAPLIADDPLADNVDVYAFRSPNRPSNVTLIATYVPMQLPQGGPNYYNFGENVRYEIHIDNDADRPGDEITYRFTFTQRNEDPTTFFNIRLGKQNLRTFYTLEKRIFSGDFIPILVNVPATPPNVGKRSIESAVGLNTTYESIMRRSTRFGATGDRVYVGHADDPFFVDLGGIFDLGDAPRQNGTPIDNLACKNVSVIALEVPIQTLTKRGAPFRPRNILDPDYVIGVWASASRKATRTLLRGEESYSGDWVQVSRLGMPLTNEAVIPIGMKDKWNGMSAYDDFGDTTMDQYFYNPELALYMDDDLFGGAVPAFAPLRIQKNSLGAFDFTNGADGLFALKGSDAVAGTALDDAIFGTLLLPGPGLPRSVDLWPAFHTGVPNFPPYQLATGKNGNPLAPGKPFVNNFLPNGGDMLRLNMAVPPTPRNSARFSSMGLINAAVLGLTDPAYNTNTNIQFIPNMDGFPNGRRLEDDVTRIELQAVAGVVLAAIGLWYDDYDPTGGREVRNIYASSNTNSTIGTFDVNDANSVSSSDFGVGNMDADGIYYASGADVLYQLDRTNNVVKAYSNFSTNPTLTATSSSDFTNGREIAVSGNRLVVAQDASDSNGNMDKFYVYQASANSITLTNTYDADINLWGIHAEGETLYAVEDVSNNLAIYENFFGNTDGAVAPTRKVSVDGLVRTHGLTYFANRDLMIMTDIGAASSATDGGIVVINNFMMASADGTISMDEQVKISGDNSLLGNPVDVAFENASNTIYVAERANGGGRILGFALPTTTGDVAPISNIAFAGASAVNFARSTSVASASPVTQDLINVLTYTTGVEENDVPFQNRFPYVAIPHAGDATCAGLQVGDAPTAARVSNPSASSIGLSTEVTGSTLMMANYPNPFKAVTTLHYLVENPTYLTVEVYDQAGRLVETLVNENRDQGEYKVDWKAGDLPMGTYYARAMADGELLQVLKLIKVK